jgi:hypothetical protein
MNEYALIFRRSSAVDLAKLSPSEIQATIKPWQDWLGGIAAQNKLVNQPIRLQNDGRVVHPHVVNNGPFSETKEIVGGLIIVKAKDLDEAAELAKGCPVLDAPFSGSVEVRPLLV